MPKKAKKTSFRKSSQKIATSQKGRSSGVEKEVDRLDRKIRGDNIIDLISDGLKDYDKRN